MEEAVVASGLTCKYGSTEAIANLSLQVEAGTIVFALLGPNGAGKTTTLRALMNIVRPSAGHATVSVASISTSRTARIATIGYVWENQRIPAWMTVDELLAYCRPFYPGWDDTLARRLIDQFDLPLTVRTSRMSRGMRVKAALVSSLTVSPASARARRTIYRTRSRRPRQSRARRARARRRGAVDSHRPRPRPRRGGAAGRHDRVPRRWTAGPERALPRSARTLPPDRRHRARTMDEAARDT